MTTPDRRLSRRDVFKWTGAVGAAATFAATLSACGTKPADRVKGKGAAGSSPDPNGTITAGISYELGTNGFDPMTTSAALTVAANWHTMEGLTEIMPSGERATYAALGAELPTKIDDTTYEVSLRRGAIFHDGTPVSADDVVFSFERVLDPDNESIYAGFLVFLDKVTKKDDTTVRLALKYPFSLVADRLAAVKIVPRAAVTKDPKGFDAKPIGTGPYRMTDNSAASKQIVFERFDAYTGPRPAKVKHMFWKVIPDDATRMNALASATIEAMDLVPDLSIKTLQATTTVEPVQGFGLLFAMFNNASAAFKDRRNRQAFLTAIDMEKVIRTSYLGNATPATCFVQQGHPAYRRAAKVYSLDQAKAKEMFGQTGLTRIKMVCTDHGWVKKATPIIKESLEAAGLGVDFTEKKSADVYNTIDADPAAYDVVIAPGDPSVFGQDADLLLRWWYGSDLWTDTRMHWKGQPSHARAVELMDRAVRQSGEQQLATWHQVFDLLSEEVPLYPLFHRKPSTAWYPETLPGFVPISVTGLSFLDTASTK